MIRYSSKRDDNHRQIVAALRSAGAFVQDMGSIGKGFVDLVVGYGGYWFVLEVKDGSKPQSARKLTPAQLQWIFDVKGRAPVHVVETVEQALSVIQGKVFVREQAI